MPASDERPPPANRSTSGRLAPLSRDPGPLFVYGTLLFPQVMRVLIDRDVTRTPATVMGWRAVALDGEVYPALVPEPGLRTRGDLVVDLTSDEWQTLDAFESPVYDLVRVHPEGAGHDAAWAYGLREEHPAPASARGRTTWSREDFAGAHLDAYLDHCARRRHQLDARRQGTSPGEG